MLGMYAPGHLRKATITRSGDGSPWPKMDIKGGLILLARKLSCTRQVRQARQFLQFVPSYRQYSAQTSWHTPTLSLRRCLLHLPTPIQICNWIKSIRHW